MFNSTLLDTCVSVRQVRLCGGVGQVEACQCTHDALPRCSVLLTSAQQASPPSLPRPRHCSTPCWGQDREEGSIMWSQALVTTCTGCTELV